MELAQGARRTPAQRLVDQPGPLYRVALLLELINSDVDLRLRELADLKSLNDLSDDERSQLEESANDVRNMVEVLHS